MLETTSKGRILGTNYDAKVLHLNTFCIKTYKTYW